VPFLVSAYLFPFGVIKASSFFLTDFLPLRADFILYSFRVVFLFFILIISCMVFLWRWFYIRRPYKKLFFYFSLLGFVLSIFLLVSRNSLFSLFLGWEGLGVTSFILIIFYQNWSRTKGGLLTLLTNRLGDALLIVRTCYWLIASSFRFFWGASRMLVVLVRVVSFTKRAQWPFIRWLPAAMAAPTPVRALVHRSTLVTAGIWLIITLGQAVLLNFKGWLILGLVTLFVASSAALVETDAKKVVALSTLSQLGLIFISLSVGRVRMCLLHVLTHALAKSNLFLVVGTILHNRFAQQDSRSLRSLRVWFVELRAVVSMSSLVGILFISGFFSKEQILLGHFIILNRISSLLILLIISSLTFAYCFKLILSLCGTRTLSSIWSPLSWFPLLFPVLALSIRTVFGGYLILTNFVGMYSPLSRSLIGAYWVLLALGGAIFRLSNLSSEGRAKLFNGFYLQLKAIEELKSLNKRFKLSSVYLESTILENMLLLISLKFSFSFNHLIKATLPLGATLMLIVLF